MKLWSGSGRHGGGGGGGGGGVRGSRFCESAHLPSVQVPQAPLQARPPAEGAGATAATAGLPARRAAK